MNITRHIQERYAERIADKEGKIDIGQYVTRNADKIKQDIEKLITYSELFYSGKIRDHDIANFYLNKHGWVIVLSKDNETVITLYKIDLGVGDELNEMYLSKSREKIDEIKAEIEEHSKYADSQLAIINGSIKDNEARILEHKRMIKMLESENDHYVAERSVLSSKRSYLNTTLQHAMEKMIGAKVF